MSPLSSQYVESDDDSSHSPAPKATSRSTKSHKAKHAVESDPESSEDKPLAKKPKHDSSSKHNTNKDRKPPRRDYADSPPPPKTKTKGKDRDKDKKRKRTDDSPPPVAAASNKKDKKPVRKVGEARRATGEVLTDDKGNPYVDLGANKRVVVSDFKGKTLVQIREYYNDNGEWKPGKKGIALPVDAWDRLKKSVAAIDSAIDDLVG
ncbi:hypothetical protein JCM3775_005093 [Rhodotorula graminis]